jgi:hypothetical protein
MDIDVEAAQPVIDAVLSSVVSVDNVETVPSLEKRWLNLHEIRLLTKENFLCLVRFLLFKNNEEKSVTALYIRGILWIVFILLFQMDEKKRPIIKTKHKIV